IDGDLAGPPFLVDLAPPVPLGTPDTFDGTLALLDTALARLLAIDLEAVFGEETALVRDELARFRGVLEMLRATLALSEAERVQLDAAFDASGLPEELRALIAELDGLTDACWRCPTSFPAPTRCTSRSKACAAPTM